MKSVKFDEVVLKTINPILKRIAELQVGLKNYLNGVKDGKGLEDYDIDFKAKAFVPSKESVQNEGKKRR